jgi:hypothetical protein
MPARSPRKLGFRIREALANSAVGSRWNCFSSLWSRRRCSASFRLYATTCFSALATATICLSGAAVRARVHVLSCTVLSSLARSCQLAHSCLARSLDRSLSWSGCPAARCLKPCRPCPVTTASTRPLWRYGKANRCQSILRKSLTFPLSAVSRAVCVQVSLA